MRILGLDPGLGTTGWGLIEAEGNRLSHLANGEIKTSPSAPLPERLARLADQLEALIGASDAAIMLVRPDLSVAYANAEMIRLVGLPRETIVGASVKRLHDFLAASLEDPETLAPQVRALNGGARLRDRIERSLPTRTVYQRVVAPVRDGTGAWVGHLLQYRDVTHEAELERMKSEFV